MLLVTNSVAHLLVDAVCASAVFTYSGDAAFAAALLLYNTLAFTGQAPAGAFIDSRLGRGGRRLLKFAASVMVAAGLLLPAGAPLILRAIPLGIGNCFFHVCGGTDTLDDSAGRAAPLGVFVAPGCIGVSVGTLWPELGKYLAFGLLAVAAGTLVYELGGAACGSEAESRREESRAFRSEVRPRPAMEIGESRMAGPVLLAAAVMVRAFGGTTVAFPWKAGAAGVMALTAAVFFGKALGGFLSDRIGAAGTAAATLIPSALLTAFASAYMAPALAGQLLLNISMPITLWLLYKEMPDKPATAFGLAAAALWPGTLLGQLAAPAEKLVPYIILAAFAFALFAVIYSSKRGKKL